MSVNITEIFGSNVFSTDVMRERLPKGVFREVMDVMENGGNISIETADIVANAMKDWAVEKGATHYTHWFQPLTGITAEKHDSFLTRPENSRTLLQLTGKQLIMGESDASSFPSGGLRSTHYARGYTAWDMTSPAFVKEMTAGTILCIPTIFVSYHGEALDKKTPLLRSMQAISTQALRILRLFGNTAAKKVIPQVGSEQEYFLVDREKYLKRRDLIYTGRTLFGAPSPKGQELEDQYFGVIRDRVGSFMADLNQELWKLGIPATTQHNEVAPAQHEMAPIFTMCNLAVDQNQLTMETMKRVATRHGLVCLLHEKPYAGVNGSGKHNNWSIGTDTGENLLDPGDTPNENLQFLLVLSCIMKAVDVHADLLRQSASCVGNEHRLGGQEAPPAIISICLGDQLESVVDQIVSNADSIQLLASGKLDSGVSTVPVLSRDATDRNRTTPFAFTGNKFEFRMPGSGVNLSDCNMILNTAMAKSLKDFADAMEGKAGEEFEAAAIDYIRDVLTAHQRIIFNGNGYSEEWTREAERRGLANHPTTADALPCFVEPKSIALFEEFGVLTETEVRSRYEVKLEKYNKLLNIEARTMKRMVRRAYLPAINSYAAEVAGHINAIRSACAGADTDQQEELLRRLLLGIKEIDTQLRALGKLHHETLEIESEQEKANTYAHEVIPVMDRLRAAVDGLEVLVDRDHWPVPTYNDILFYV